MADYEHGILGNVSVTFFLALIGIAVLFWVFSRIGKRATERNEADRLTWLKEGANVATASGFLGTIVDIDGDAVTLQSPSGQETVWLKAAINRPMEIPLAPVSEEEALEAIDEESGNTEPDSDGASA